MTIVQRMTVRIPYLQKSPTPIDRGFAEVLTTILNMREAINLEAAYNSGTVEGAMLQASVSSVDACLEILEQLWEDNENQ
jgi:hypothetical protein